MQCGKILDFLECTDEQSANIPKNPKNLHSHTANARIVRESGIDFSQNNIDFSENNNPPFPNCQNVAERATNDKKSPPSLAERGLKGREKPTLESSPKSSLESNAESSLETDLQNPRGNPNSPLPCGGGQGGLVKTSDNLSLRENRQDFRSNPQTKPCHTEGAQATEVSQSTRSESFLLHQNRDILLTLNMTNNAQCTKSDTNVAKITCHANADAFAFNDSAKNVIESKNSTKQQNPLFVATYFLQTSGVVDKRGIGKILSLFSHLKNLKKIYHIFKKHDIKAVISVGGFSAAPASFGAIIFGKPLFIHEQNAIKGRLNALLSPFARCVFSSFGANHIAYPTKTQARANARIRDEVKTIAFIGGSQGARTINALAIKLSKTLLERGFSIIHQCGQNELKSTQEAYKKLGITYRLEGHLQANDSSNNIDIFGFSKDIISKLNRADICIGRAGASSVWENAALGLPMIYIPYPYAASNHQAHNAEFFTSKELGFVVLEDKGEKSAQKLESMEKQILTHIDFFAKNNKKLESISTALIALAKENGAQKIIDEILETLN
ncbi:UDP-N-acetylglucosamine--N-acetylmuramyl-(pentapeptide) pyrophosphoryl-undecaprenol N-acetylglucosamine transferase [Helicobacter sp. T3_23-1059]